MKAEPAVAKIGPALEHQIEQLLDLATTARLARDRQQQQLRGTERDLGLLLGRRALDRIEEPAQRTDRVRIVEDLDDRRAARRPIARRLAPAGIREQLVVIDDAGDRVELGGRNRAGLLARLRRFALRLGSQASLRAFAGFARGFAAFGFAFFFARGFAFALFCRAGVLTFGFFAAATTS